MIAQLHYKWLLLLHQIPPSPPYFRAKILRRLNQLGALPVKNSAYLMPETNETIEDLEWIRAEVSQQGGSAWLFSVGVRSGLSDASLVAAFQALRDKDYNQLLDSAAELLRSVEAAGGGQENHGTALGKVRRRLDEVRKIDFFAAPSREEVEAIMKKIESLLSRAVPPIAAKPALEDLQNRVWVTRRGVKVDRIATVWLIRHFVDPGAAIHFVEPDHYQPASGEIRFDMFEGEFTHEGDLCTFEVLLQHLNRRDPALEAIAQVVHDIDLKDEKHQRPETKGIAAILDGIASLHPDDEKRVEEGSRLFEAVYATLRATNKR